MSRLKLFLAERPRGADDGELRLPPPPALPFSAVVELVTFELDVNEDTEAGDGDDDPFGEVDEAGTPALSLSLVAPMLSTLCGGDDSRWRRCARRSNTSALLPVLLSTFILDCVGVVCLCLLVSAGEEMSR